MASYCFGTLSVSQFLNKVKQPNFLELANQEFNQLNTISLEGTTHNFSKKENSYRNRYHDVPCWDHSRVILAAHGKQIYDYPNRSSWDIVVTNEDSDSEYIHANFVDGFKEPRKFICCQGPKENTAGDFWRLIWQEGTRIIVALTETDPSGDCFEYWVQTEGYRLVFGRYIVETLEIKQEFGFEITKLRLIDLTTEQSRIITHFWYVNWPNYGVPTHLEEFITLLTQVNCHQQKLIEGAAFCDHPKPGPIVVHCSAGVGRTGSFCAVDCAIDKFKEEKNISIPNMVIKIRKMRHSSVITLQQYVFLYKVMEYVLSTTE